MDHHEPPPPQWLQERIRDDMLAAMQARADRPYRVSRLCSHIPVTQELLDDMAAMDAEPQVEFAWEFQRLELAAARARAIAAALMLAVAVATLVLLWVLS